MKKNCEWDLLDHKWNNFKKWFKAMETKKDKPYVTMESMRSMIDFCDTFEDKIYDAEKFLKELNN